MWCEEIRRRERGEADGNSVTAVGVKTGAGEATLLTATPA
jgi:hypothetical protein